MKNLPNGILIVATLICLLCTTEVQAGFFDGTKLFQILEKDIRGTTDYYESGVGTGYVIGVFDFAVDVLFCPPAGDSGITIKQAKHIVYNYMQKHPEQWNQSAFHLVIEAFVEAYPCKK